MQSSPIGKTTNGSRRRQDGKTSGGEEAHVPVVEAAAECWAWGRDEARESGRFRAPVRGIRMNCESSRAGETPPEHWPLPGYSGSDRSQSKSRIRSIGNGNRTQDVKPEVDTCPEQRSSVRRSCELSRECNMQRKQSSALRALVRASVRGRNERAKGDDEIGFGGRTGLSGCRGKEDCLKENQKTKYVRSRVLFDLVSPSTVACYDPSAWIAPG